jgi:hypothetical protein
MDFPQLVVSFFPVGKQSLLRLQTIEEFRLQLIDIAMEVTVVGVYTLGECVRIERKREKEKGEEESQSFHNDALTLQAKGNRLATKMGESLSFNRSAIPAPPAIRESGSGFFPPD